MIEIYKKVNFKRLDEHRTREWMVDEAFDWEDTNPQLFSLDFLREMKDKLNWTWVSEFRVFTSREIKEFEDRINWYKFSCYQSMTPEIIDRYEDNWNYNMLGSFQKLTEEFVWRNKHRVNWRVMVTHQNFSKEFWQKCLDSEIIPSPWLRDTVRQRIASSEIEEKVH